MYVANGTNHTNQSFILLLGAVYDLQGPKK